jgi:hypothetical protein
MVMVSGDSMVDMAALGLRTPTFYPLRPGAARTGRACITNIQKVSKEVKILESHMTSRIFVTYGSYRRHGVSMAA